MEAGSPYRLLLAQEDKEIAQVLHKYFQGRGMAVDLVLDASAAWASFLSNAPDIVILDVALPGGGVDVLVRIRNHSSRSRTPVMLVGSGIHNPAEEAVWKDVHKADIVFRKPLPLKEVVAQADDLVGRFNGKRRGGATLTSMPATSIPSTPTPSGVPSTPGVSRVPIRTGSFGRPPTVPGPRSALANALSGDSNLPSLAALAVEIFEQKLSGVVDVRVVGALRRLHFHDGFLVDIQSLIMGEQLPSPASNPGVPPMQLLERTVEAAKTLAAKALLGGSGTFEMGAWEENAVLAARFRLDPVEAVVRACLELPSDLDALKTLAGLESMPLQPGPFFRARVTLLQEVRPQSSLAMRLVPPMTVREAIALARDAGPSGVRELLAIILSRAVQLGNSRVGSTRSPHPHVVLSPWRRAGLPAESQVAREAVAAEWARTVGQDAYVTLGVDRDAPDTAAVSSVASLRQRFGPPAMEDADLGPLRPTLDLLRARREEAAHILSSATNRFAYNAALRAMGQR